MDIKILNKKLKILDKKINMCNEKKQELDRQYKEIVNKENQEEINKLCNDINDVIVEKDKLYSQKREILYTIRELNDTNTYIGKIFNVIRNILLPGTFIAIYDTKKVIRYEKNNISLNKIEPLNGLRAIIPKVVILTLLFIMQIPLPIAIILTSILLTDVAITCALSSMMSCDCLDIDTPLSIKNVTDKIENISLRKQKIKKLQESKRFLLHEKEISENKTTEKDKVNTKK